MPSQWKVESDIQSNDRSRRIVVSEIDNALGVNELYTIELHVDRPTEDFEQELLREARKRRASLLRNPKPKTPMNLVGFEARVVS